MTAERWRNLRATDSVSKQEADEKISLAASTMRRCRRRTRIVQRLRELSGFEKIVAPFDGVVTARNTDIGQLIDAGSNTGPGAVSRRGHAGGCACTCACRRRMRPMMKPGLTAELCCSRTGRAS